MRGIQGQAEIFQRTGAGQHKMAAAENIIKGKLMHETLWWGSGEPARGGAETFFFYNSRESELRQSTGAAGQVSASKCPPGPAGR